MITKAKARFGRANTEAQSTKAKKVVSVEEKPLDIINITLMKDQAKNLIKAVEKLPIDIKQTIFGLIENNSSKRFIEIQKFLSSGVRLPTSMTTLLREKFTNEVLYKFIYVQICLDTFPMEFDIPSFSNKVRIGELFDYGMIESTTWTT